VPREPIELTDPQVIKAIAHPARFRVIEELYAGRTLTATQAGQLCGLTGSAMSYHLRQLEKYGLVVADGSVDGRERPWRAAGHGLKIEPLERTPANEIVGRAYLANVQDAIRRMLDANASGNSSSAFGVSYTQGRLRLTDEQARALDARVEKLIKEFEQEEEPAGPDAPPLRVFFWLRGNDPNG
jgi:DNA-binding transcriptional ArsR family regulator